ncbi:hypothetical protein LTR17_003072 [Elasticomyces elasticus]|nr:hypothetical protein LTR17_003072 [Elasticomyces elasticus]
MAARRSSRIAVGNVNKSKAIHNFIAEARHQVLTDNRAAVEVKYADVKCKFDIFDLIPELRGRIFYHAMELEKPRQLALASKQVRAEILPIFFGKGHFIVFLYSNYERMRQLDLMALPAGLRNSSVGFGTLGLSTTGHTAVA